MQELQKFLEERLENCERLAVLGVGSLQSSDDAAGVVIASKIKESFEEEKYPGLRVYLGYTAPENFTGEIKRFKPCHLIILDAADMREEPGSIMVIQPEVINGVSFSTHMLPLKVMADYLKKETGCEMIILGIQSVDVSYGGEMTPKVMEAVDEVTDIIGKVITATRGLSNKGTVPLLFRETHGDGSRGSRLGYSQILGDIPDT